MGERFWGSHRGGCHLCNVTCCLLMRASEDRQVDSLALHQEDTLQYPLLEGSAGDYDKRVPFRADLNLTSTITYSGYLSQDQFLALRLSFLI